MKNKFMKLGNFSFNMTKFDIKAVGHNSMDMFVTGLTILSIIKPNR